PWEVVRMRKFVTLVSVLVSLGAAGFGVWYSRASGHPEEPFRTEEVGRGDLLASFSATGTLEPEDIIDVGAQVAGQIQAFGRDARTGKEIDYGSEAEARAAPAKIEDSLYSAKGAQSRALVTVARAAYEQAVAKVDDAVANVKLSEANLQSARANFDHAKRDWDRALALSPGKALAQADYDTYLS